MKRRTFTKATSAIITGSLLTPLIPYAQDEKLKNWAGNYTYSTDNLHQPKTIVEVREMIKSHNKLKALGSRHSFNGIADSRKNLLSLMLLKDDMTLDRASQTVTVNAGVKYGELAPYLHINGYALHNLASLPHISIAGACATATHGSGDNNGNLATAVSALELVTADGEILKLSRKKDGEKFQAAVVGLGGLGVITRLTLDVVPTFDVRQDVYLDLPLQEFGENFEEITSSGYSVSLFTDWKYERFNQLWIKNKTGDAKPFEPEPKLFGAKRATRNVHPIIELSAENCTAQMGVPGPWHERLPHFRMDFTPSSGEELQSEYFIPRRHAVDAIKAVYQMQTQITPHLFISEIRTIAADDLWMSPCYQQPCVAIHFTWRQDWPAVRKLLPLIEKELAPYDVRPHWGKLFTVSPARLKSLYVKLPAFREMLKQYDPNGKFRNAFLDRNIYGA